NGQLSTCQTPAQVTCAHCQRSWNRPQRLVPSSSPKCPREPHTLPAFSGTSTPREEFFSIPEGAAGWSVAGPRVGRFRVPPAARARRVHVASRVGKVVAGVGSDRLLSEARRGPPRNPPVPRAHRAVSGVVPLLLGCAALPGCGGNP